MTNQTVIKGLIALKGWTLSGDQAMNYEVGLDRTQAHTGQACAYIKSRPYQNGGFGTLMQICQAGSYRGQRVRMSGYVRTRGVITWAGLWLRVDGEDGKMLSFDNMQSRPICGTTEWQRYEVVLDVPPEAVSLFYGLLLTGKGQAWVDDFAFEAVSQAVPVTGTSGPVYPEQPVNLGFEEFEA